MAPLRQNWWLKEGIEPLANAERLQRPVRSHRTLQQPLKLEPSSGVEPLYYRFAIGTLAAQARRT